MSTNYRQARKDDSSDDEGPTKRVKHSHHDDDDEEAPVGRPAQAPATNKKVSRNVWADVVQEEELTIRGNVMDMHDYRKKSGGLVKINRGAESYSVPSAKLEENAAAFEAHHNMDDQLPVPTPTASDDPFGDTADLGEVEAFGVGPSSGRSTANNNSNNRGGGWQPRGGGGGGAGRGGGGAWGPRGGWMHKSRGGAAHAAPQAETGEQMETGGEGGAVAPNARGGGGRGGFGGGGGRGFIPRGRGGQWRGGDRKRTWNNEEHAHAKDPAELMDNGYSLEGLLATEFQEGLTPKELGEAIDKAFGESVPDTVVKITEAVGEKKALELFEETKKAEQEGGVKVADGSRRRTPGGVIILLFKADVNVDPSVKGSIFEDSKTQQRKMLKARKRKGVKKDQDTSKDLDELERLLEEKKQELLEGKKDSSPEEGEATPSPAVADDGGNEELDYTEDDESPVEEGTEME